MDPTRFDTLAKSLGHARSRRTLLRTLGATALGGLGLAGHGQPAGAAPEGNSGAAQWCHQTFRGAAAGQCTRAAAQGSGPYYTSCASPAGPAEGAACTPSGGGSGTCQGGSCVACGGGGAPCTSNTECCSGFCPVPGSIFGCCPSCPSGCACHGTEEQTAVCSTGNPGRPCSFSADCDLGEACIGRVCETLCTPL